MEPKQITRNLKCVLSQHEKLDMGQALAKAEQDYTEAEDRKKEVASQLKAEVEAARGMARSLSQKLNNGYEYRDVSCEIEYDVKNNAAIVVRLDTAEEIDRRPMTEDERQGTMEFE